MFCHTASPSEREDLLVAFRPPAPILYLLRPLIYSNTSSSPHSFFTSDQCSTCFPPAVVHLPSPESRRVLTLFPVFPIRTHFMQTSLITHYDIVHPSFSSSHTWNSSLISLLFPHLSLGLARFECTVPPIATFFQPSRLTLSYQRQISLTSSSHKHFLRCTTRDSDALVSVTTALESTYV